MRNDTGCESQHVDVDGEGEGEGEEESGLRMQWASAMISSSLLESRERGSHQGPVVICHVSFVNY